MPVMPRQYCKYCGTLLFIGDKECPQCGMPREVRYSLGKVNQE